MRRLVNLATTVLTALALLGATGPVQIRTTGPANTIRYVVLTGNVTRLEGHSALPVSGASLELRSTKDATTVAAVVSDARGRYIFSNPDPADAPADIPGGLYRLFARYRSSSKDVGLTRVMVHKTSTVNVSLGNVLLVGGASSAPTPAIAFYATDRLFSGRTDSLGGAFENTRLIDPCLTGPDCAMHYGEVDPLGPTFGPPQDTTSFPAFVDMMRAKYPNASSVLVSVHGFNNDIDVPFQTGATWLASFDPASPVIVFSWPSNHKTLKYLDDETNNTWAADDFRDLLEALLNAPNGFSNVNIIAHSMGNRLAVSALDYLGHAKPKTPNRINHVILVAPDVDSATLFGELTTMAQASGDITLYGSDHDNALRLSRAVHGHCRGGLVGCDFAIPPIANINSIDASFFHCDFLGHGYWNASSTMRADIAAVLRDGINGTTGSPPAFRMRPHLNLIAQPNRYAFDSAEPDDGPCDALPVDSDDST